MMILAARPGGIATKAYPDLAASSRREERGMRPNRLRRPGWNSPGRGRSSPERGNTTCA